MEKIAEIVAPRAGAWIETGSGFCCCDINPVAPRAGAWIETYLPTSFFLLVCVAPRAGAWIETLIIELSTGLKMSPPARGRGLKPVSEEDRNQSASVAPRAGAWIETIKPYSI